MISAREYVRRLRSVSDMRSLIVGLKRSGIAAYERGELNIRPRLDIRSDVEYWKRIAREQGVEIEGEEG